VYARGSGSGSHFETLFLYIFLIFNLFTVSNTTMVTNRQ